jgi:hypothetical protein
MERKEGREEGRQEIKTEKGREEGRKEIKIDKRKERREGIHRQGRGGFVHPVPGSTRYAEYPLSLGRKEGRKERKGKERRKEGKGKKEGREGKGRERKDVRT